MIIVSGTPRCGSSLMMLCILRTIGEQNIVGAKFPEPRKRELRIFSKKQTPAGITETETKQTIKRRESRKDFNPLGFWESKYVGRGFSYDLENIEEFERLKNAKDKAVKILGRGLVRTEPKYVDKLIICLRNPYDIAVSQKKLNRPNSKISANPDTQIRHYSLILDYIKAHPDIPRLIIDYDDHKKSTVMKDLSEFLGKPEAVSPYKNKISKNSTSGPIKGRGWKKAFNIQDSIKNI